MEVPELNSEDMNQFYLFEQNFEDWMELRQQTISTLRCIATYIESIHRKSTIAKAVGSGSGIIAGGLTLVGGAITIATGGLAAVPVLIGPYYSFSTLFCNGLFIHHDSLMYKQIYYINKVPSLRRGVSVTRKIS